MFWTELTKLLCQTKKKSPRFNLAFVGIIDFIIWDIDQKEPLMHQSLPFTWIYKINPHNGIDSFSRHEYYQDLRSNFPTFITQSVNNTFMLFGFCLQKIITILDIFYIF